MDEKEAQAKADAFIEDVAQPDEQIEVIARIFHTTGLNEELVVQRLIELDTDS